MDAFADTRRLDRFAGEIGGGVLLLGHPNKAGDEFSGSTARENQVLSRIYRSPPEPDTNGVADPDARRLTKASRLAGQSCAIAAGTTWTLWSPRPVASATPAIASVPTVNPIRAALISTSTNRSSAIGSEPIGARRLQQPYASNAVRTPRLMSRRAARPAPEHVTQVG